MQQNVNITNSKDVNIIQTEQLRTAHVLFMDIVGYSKLKSEQQVKTMATLNQIVKDCLPEERRLMLPTGDGMVIVFLTNPESPLLTAQKIAPKVKEAKIPLRMGMHTGPVYLIEDIKQQENIVGGGINLAQRVMDCGDEGHILASEEVARALSGVKEEYERLFHYLGKFEVKHGVKIEIYNVYGEGFGNPEPAQKKPESDLTIPRILVLFSSPLVDTKGKPLTRLDFESEKGEILSYLQKSKVRFQIRFTPATTEWFQKHILAEDFDILHFSGHGGEGYLVFEDNLAQAHQLDQEQICRLLQSSATPVKLVFLSACHSASVAEGFIKTGIRHVVAIERSKPILDWSAKVFTRNFYLALAVGKTVEEAYQAGLIAVNTDPMIGEKARVEEKKFRLLPDDVSHKERIFTNLPAGKIDDISDKLPPSNIGEQVKPFVGRERLMQRTITALFNNRLVSLIGLGGIGKTATAREIARWYRQRNHFSSGIYLIDLDAVESVELMRRRVADAIELGAVEKDEDVAAALASGEYLFVLDNLETVLRKNRLGVRQLLQTLLEKAPSLRLLVTSRELIGGMGEKKIEVPRLSPPEAEELLFTLAKKVCDIRQLESSSSISRLLELLDSYPLAMVLAVPRLESLNIEELVERLEKGLGDVYSDPLLTEEEKTKLTSVFVSLELSYQWLKETDGDSVRLFPLLSLFPGGVSGQALTKIIGQWWKDGVEKLRHNSLVEHRDDWYYLPVPLRRYAQRLLPEEALSQYAPAALKYYHGRVSTLSKGLGEELSMVRQLAISQELPNIYAFMDWGVEKEGLETDSQCYTAAIASTLGFYYQFSGQYQEGIRRAEQGIQASRRTGEISGEANCLQALGDLCLRTADLEGAQRNYDAALPKYREIGDRLGEANCLKSLGDLYLRTADLEGAQRNYDAALPKYREIGERLGEANCLRSQTKLLGLSGHLEQAFQLFEIAMGFYKQTDDLYSQALTLMDRAPFWNIVGETEKALSELETARQIFLKIGLPQAVDYVKERILELKSGQDK